MLKIDGINEEKQTKLNITKGGETYGCIFAETGGANTKIRYKIKNRNR